ncbi:MAG: hypothetical protein ACPLRW_05675 [Moorellales bacterium]
MPIKGWTDAVRVPRLGQIALGYKDEKGAPRSVDYFVVPPEVQEVYGPQPRELDILIPGEDLDKVFPAWLKRYGDQFGLICRGDGETATLSAVYARKFGQEYGIAAKKLAAAAGAENLEGWQYVFSATGEVVAVEVGGDGAGWLRIPCAYKDCPHYRARKCTEVALLSVLLPKVPGVLGVYQLDTGSFHSYQNIVNSLEILRRIVGRISFIPLKLKVRMETHHPLVVHNGQEKRVRSTNPVLYIDMGDLTLEKALQMAREGRLLQVAALPPVKPLAIEPPEERKPELLYPPEETSVPETNLAEIVPEPDLNPAVGPEDSAGGERAVAGAAVPAAEEKASAEASAAQTRIALEQAPDGGTGTAGDTAALKGTGVEKEAGEIEEDLVFQVTQAPKKAQDRRGITVVVSARLLAGAGVPEICRVMAAFGAEPVMRFLASLKEGEKFVVPGPAVRLVKGSSVMITEAVSYVEPPVDVLADLGEELEGLEEEAF